MIKNILVGSFICGLFLMLGCARSVSSRETILNMEIQISFEGNVDLSENYYYMAFSGVSEPLVPTENLLPDTPEYFITPGRGYDESNETLYDFDRTINYFYEKFYKTWSDYIVCYQDNSGVRKIKLYKSDAASFDSTTSGTQHYGYIPADKFDYEFKIIENDTIELKCQLQDFSAIPTTLYFTFFTAKKNTNSHIENDESGYIQDTLVQSDGLTSIKVEFGGDTEERPEQQNFALESNEAADIRAWRIRFR